MYIHGYSTMQTRGSKRLRDQWAGKSPETLGRNLSSHRQYKMKERQALDSTG